MRELNIGTKRYTVVTADDEPGQGGACHEYNIRSIPKDPGNPQAVFGHIRFQNGPVKENPLNGCFDPDLIAIVIDRLEHFQAGAFKCE